MKIIYIVGALAALTALTGCQPKPQRYQVVFAYTSGYMIKIDAETGRSWQLSSGMWAPLIDAPSQ